QYVRTITNAGAACHIDKWVNYNPEETTQLPVHLDIDRINLIQNPDSRENVSSSPKQQSTFSEEMRQEILEMDMVRKKSDVFIASLFTFLLLTLIAAAVYLFLL
ncbi:MAG: hypothetical protein WBN45_12260, partial [Arenicellales bacterium]